MSVIKCKHCGAEDGFYTRQRVKGSATFRYTKEGHHAKDNGDMHEGIWYEGGVWAYCESCNKVLGRSENLVTGRNEQDFY